MEFYCTYAPHFLSWGRDILEQDPYDIVDEIHDEGVKRKWAA